MCEGPRAREISLIRAVDQWGVTDFHLPAHP
jgi:hypothetical protein